MIKRPYAAGLAVLVTLLLSAAVGVEWVDVPGGVQEPAPLQAPPGLALASLGDNPEPQMTGGQDDLDYVYIDPSGGGGNVFPW